LFIAGVWAAWNFFQANEPVGQLRWGLPAAVLLIVATIMKMALLPRMESNRLMRELKRIELQLARSHHHIDVSARTSGATSGGLRGGAQ
jgi:hypothetical protein